MFDFQPYRHVHAGKQSLTRFAAAIEGFQAVSIELRRGYGASEFREDLKGLCNTAGVEGKPVVFLLSDTQARGR